MLLSMANHLAAASPTLSDPPPAEVGVGYTDMADLARANERLRASLASSQKRVSELHDSLDAQRKTNQELLSKMRDLERRMGEASADQRPRTWFENLLRWGKPEPVKTSAEITGCQSISCCLTLLSRWALETGKFLLTGVWEFFWDPVAWWKGARGSLQAVLETQLQMGSRVVGFLLMGIYINGISWVCLRIRSIGGAIRGGVGWVMGLSTISLARLVFLWGARKAMAGIPEARQDKTAKLLEKMEEMTKAIRQLQSQTTRAPQRAAPVTGNDRPRRPCPNCGRTGHNLVGCREPKRCLKCKSSKHLARDCPQVQRLEVGKTPGGTSPPRSVVDFNCDELVSRVEEICRDAREEINAAEGSRAPVLHVRAGVGSSKELVLLDTGSSCNVMPLSVAATQGLDIDTESEESKMKLRAFNGTSSGVTGTTLVSVTIGRWKATIPFLVTDACSSIIVGMPGLRDLDVKLDPAKRRLEDRMGHLVICQRAELEAPAYTLEIASKN